MCVLCCSTCRCEWVKYFSKDKSIVVAFWSAKMEMDRIDSEARGCGTSEEGCEDRDASDGSDEGDIVCLCVRCADNLLYVSRE